MIAFLVATPLLEVAAVDRVAVDHHEAAELLEVARFICARAAFLFIEGDDLRALLLVDHADHLLQARAGFLGRGGLTAEMVTQ